MKKMLVLTRFVKEYEPKRIAEEGRNKGWGVDVVKYGQVSLGVVDGEPVIDLGKNRNLAGYDLVVARAASKKGSSMVGVKTAILSQLDVKKVVNGVSFEKYPLLGKMEQGVMLAKVGLPTVDFLSFGSKNGWKDFKKSPEYQFPLMIKGRFGSHGRTVRLVNDWEQFGRVFSEYKAGSVLVQPKIRARQWYRCIVVGGKYLGEMRHRQKSKYGGEEGTLVKFNTSKMKQLREICVNATALFECDYAGLDVLWDEDKQGWVILEVNRTAQFKYFEKRTGVNVAKALIECLRG